MFCLKSALMMMMMFASPAYVHTSPDLAYVHSMYLHITPFTTHNTLYNTIPDIPTSLNEARTQVLSTYYDSLTTNINPEFIRANPVALIFLRSNISLAVFCLEAWQGINGLEPCSWSFCS